jgi:thiamine-phosphate pyrophosphorylase
MSNARLYLITPRVSDPASFRPLLEGAVGATRVDAVHLRLALSAERDAQRLIQALAPVVQDKGAALIIDPPADLREVARWGADGVHVNDPDHLKEALQAMKPDRIVGAGGLRSKDAAMEAGEAGVDYVMFGEPRADDTVPPSGQVIDRCQWWAEVFTTPCVGYAADLAMVEPLAATGVEFVALGEWLFNGSAAEVGERMLVAAAAART